MDVQLYMKRAKENAPQYHLGNQRKNSDFGPNRHQASQPKTRILIDAQTARPSSNTEPIKTRELNITPVT